MLKIQSIQASLAHIDEVKLPDIVEINTCLAAANNSFREVLRASPAGKDPK
jgi:hypothetical protein